MTTPMPTGSNVSPRTTQLAAPANPRSDRRPEKTLTLLPKPHPDHCTRNSQKRL